MLNGIRTVVPCWIRRLSLNHVLSQELCHLLRMRDLTCVLFAVGGEASVVLKVLASFEAGSGEHARVSWGGGERWISRIN